MGYNIGAKGVAIGLLALTNGDRARAEAVWDRIRGLDPVDVSQALDFVEEALAAEPASAEDMPTEEAEPTRYPCCEHCTEEIRDHADDWRDRHVIPCARCGQDGARR